MSDCAEVETLLALRADGALDAENARLLDEHLGQCDACRALAQSLLPQTLAAGPEGRRPQRGDLVGGRFAIEAFVREGGMGAVYRALDRETGLPVALKVMRSREDEIERFSQEARLLAELAHPCVVEDVAHGSNLDGELYRATE